MQNRLTALEQGYLEVEDLQELDQGCLKTWILETILDAPDETDGVDFRSDVLQEAADECCRAEQMLIDAHRRQFKYRRGLVSEYRRKSSQRSSSFCFFAKSIAYSMTSHEPSHPYLDSDEETPRTRLTSPNRSMIRYNAFLLFPIRPRRKTISGTRSRSVQILYAFGHVSLRTKG